MTISYNWLKDYIKCDLSAEQVAEALTSIGLEVDGVETVEQIPGGLKGVVVGEVLTCIEHPDSDHLHVTTLNIGEAEPIQVVCGAPNVAAGQKVLVATIGTVLGEDFKIKKGKMRGVESWGMICAEDELGIGTDHAGIMVLEPEAVVGTPAKEYLHLKEDTVIEIGLTANRVDAASHIGVARDLFAYCNAHDIPCALTLPSAEEIKGAGEATPITVVAEDDAPRYSGITIKGVKVGPSPAWLAERLMAIGHKPINNIVDITNYVLFEVGQPLHAFDLAEVEGGAVVVRRAEEGEKFVTLDGVERTLRGTDLVIANAAGKPMCLAGVFGGEKSGVKDGTTDIFLESAYFNPMTIRKTSKIHTLKTDASFRYERGCDPLINEWAAWRAASLICEIAGGEVVGEIQKVYSREISKKRIDLNFDRIEAFIGHKIGHNTIHDILEYLGYEFVSEEGADVVVNAPSYMIDVYRECDVVEEILRIYGYNNIPLPSTVRMSITASDEKMEPEKIREKISDFLAANGFNEIMNNSLTKGDYYTSLKTYPRENCVEILNPLSSDLNVMRQTLLLSGLEVIAYNNNRQINSMKLFEYGSVYSIAADADKTVHDSYREHTAFSMFLTGPVEKTWRRATGKSSFYTLKGYFELLLKRIGADYYMLQTSEAPTDIFAEGIRYCLPGSGAELAVLGTIAPALAKKFGVKQPVYAIEISWPVLFTLIKRTNIKYKEMPKFPEVKRDFAIILDESVQYADLRRSAFKACRKVLKDVTLFDVYRGAGILVGKKQYALSFTLQDEDKTLTDIEVEKIMNRLLQTFQNEYGAVLR